MEPVGADKLAFAIADLVDVGVFAVDRGMRVVIWNGFMERHSGRARADMLGGSLFDVFPDLPEKWLRRKFESVFLLGSYAFSGWEHRPYLFRFDHNRPITGGLDAMRQNCTFIPIRDGEDVTAVCVTITDMTDICIAYQELQKRERLVSDALEQLTERNHELSSANAQLEQAHQQLLQSEKLAAIGQLAAGVAHEINNPVGFVLSNLNSLESYVHDLLEVIDAYMGAEASLGTEERGRLSAARRDADLDYVREDAPALLRESREGLARVREIVVDLRDFSRVDTSHAWEWVDLHRCIESTLNIVGKEVRYRAELVRCFGELPQVRCIPSQIGQVVLNLVINAAHACAGTGTDAVSGMVCVRTGIVAGEDAVWIEVQDTGCGIAPENMKRIFEPFFTTKPVGQGTGLGLSVTYGIVSAHGGTIDVRSVVNQGTTFRIVLPVDHAGPRPAVEHTALAVGRS
ncbi:ATP-binding protein [Paraburkholderia phosphatilytica]|uniref:ATP-binding protein n=1 Tax=Paraburkholderia phosphatilytica TaxID=2282883 RepID=UPI000E5577EE|nr:ATP-binding protein [Paraburkholderia phosphatilytica]